MTASLLLWMRFSAVFVIMAGAVASDIQVIKCGLNKYSDSAMVRTGGLPDSVNAGESVSAFKHPWIAKLEYPGKDDQRQCAGSLISDRHILTARRCVDPKGPKGRSNDILKPSEVMIRAGIGTNYELTKNVANISVYKGLDPRGKEYAADFAVLELSEADKFEFKEYVRPICLASEFDYFEGADATGLFYGNTTTDGETTRPLYEVHTDLLSAGRCAKALGDNLHGDEFCVVKENLVFVEGINTGAPILQQHPVEKNRYIQVGIALMPDETNSVGSATRIDLYWSVIQDLTNCYIFGKDIHTVQTSDPSKGCGVAQCIQECYKK